MGGKRCFWTGGTRRPKPPSRQKRRRRREAAQSRPAPCGPLALALTGLLHFGGGLSKNNHAKRRPAQFTAKPPRAAQCGKRTRGLGPRGQLGTMAGVGAAFKQAHAAEGGGLYKPPGTPDAAQSRSVSGAVTARPRRRRRHRPAHWDGGGQLPTGLEVSGTAAPRARKQERRRAPSPARGAPKRRGRYGTQRPTKAPRAVRQGGDWRADDETPRARGRSPAERRSRGAGGSRGPGP